MAFASGLAAWQYPPFVNYDWPAEAHAITSAALKPLTELSGQSVDYTEFNALVRDLGYSDPEKFNEQMLISKKYLFPPKLGEEPGKSVAVLDVLSKYSDEPDWGMDQELFGEDEYPEIWQDAYSMMGGKLGVPSQAFRHMFWQGFNLAHPLRTFKLPLGEILHSMGEAPERAARFIELSHLARRAGHPYWAVRFVADALHYLEDCSQPYHTAQTPTKRFMGFPLFHKNGHGFDRYVEQVTHVIAYYHYSFEMFVSKLMVASAAGDANTPGAEFIKDLTADTSGPSGLSYDNDNIGESVMAIAKLASSKAPAAGTASIAFFPTIQDDLIEMDPRFNDISKGLNPDNLGHMQGFMDQAWWTEAKASGAVDSKARRNYFKVVKDMFGALGFAIRQVVSSELDLR